MFKMLGGLVRELAELAGMSSLSLRSEVFVLEQHGNELRVAIPDTQLSANEDEPLTVLSLGELDDIATIGGMDDYGNYRRRPTKSVELTDDGCFIIRCGAIPELV